MTIQKLNIIQSQWLDTKKHQIFESNVCLMLLYGSEAWKTNAECESHFKGFEGCHIKKNLSNSLGTVSNVCRDCAEDRSQEHHK